MAKKRCYGGRSMEKVYVIITIVFVGLSLLLALSGALPKSKHKDWHDQDGK